MEKTRKDDLGKTPTPARDAKEEWGEYLRDLSLCPVEKLTSNEVMDLLGLTRPNYLPPRHKPSMAKIMDDLGM